MIMRMICSSREDRHIVERFNQRGPGQIKISTTDAIDETNPGPSFVSVADPNKHNRGGQRHGFVTGGRRTDNRSATLLMNLSCDIDPNDLINPAMPADRQS